MGRKIVYLVLGLALAAPADAFVARNDLLVESLGAGAFTVPYRGKSGPRDFWCAAGDYAIRALRVPKATRIYRTSAPPRGPGQGMSFSLDRSRATGTGLLRLSRDPGVTAAYARFLCDRHETRR